MPSDMDTTLKRSDEFSDLTIECQGNIFRVHKFIICARSEVLAAAIKGNFKEAATGVITISEFDSETVERMIDGIYTGSYCGPPPPASKNPTFSLRPDEPPQTEPAVHARVAMIADYYRIEPLKQAANKRLKTFFLSHWNIADYIHILATAVKANAGDILADGLQSAATQHIEQLITIPEFQAINLPARMAMHIIISTTGDSTKQFNDLSALHERNVTYLKNRYNEGCTNCKSKASLVIVKSTGGVSKGLWHCYLCGKYLKEHLA